MADDIAEFLEATSQYKPKTNDSPSLMKQIVDSIESAETKVDPGQPVQYSLYKDGFVSATSTVSHLPAGCYDICVDNRVGVYVSKALPPTGLLLDLPEMKSKNIIDLVENFWASEKDYKEGNEYVIGGARYKCGIMLFGPPGCHAKDTEILMHNGSIKKIQDVIVGDKLMGPDSKPREVLQLKQGRELMVKVIPTKGESFVVNKSHILHLTPSHENETVSCALNIKVEDIIEKTAGPFKDRFKLTRTGVNFSEKELEIPPYILGIWLGDGTSSRSEITSMDAEIINEWNNWAESLGLGLTVDCTTKKAKHYTISSKTSFGGEDRNNALTLLKSLNLINNKHIPLKYLTGSKQQRLELLAGLIDTDGSTGIGVTARGKKGVGYDFISKWEHLADQVIYLSRSLGFAAYKKKCTKGCYVGKQKYFEGEYYRVSISGDLDEVPVRLERKKCKKREQIKNVLRTGFKFETLPEDDFYGFTLDQDHLYLTADFMIHHNSGKSCTIKLLSRALVERDGIVFFADSSPGHVNSFLTDFMKIEKTRKCIVILEDFDDLVANYGETAYLQMLDSAKTIDNVLFIATTNYPDRLDPRIYNRPGRFSHVIKIGNPGIEARRAYLKAVLKKHDEVELIIEKTAGFTIDHLSSLIDARYREKKELIPEIDRLRMLFKVPRVEEGDGAITLGKKAGI